MDSPNSYAVWVPNTDPSDTHNEDILLEDPDDHFITQSNINSKDSSDDEDAVCLDRELLTADFLNLNSSLDQDITTVPSSLTPLKGLGNMTLDTSNTDSCEVTVSLPKPANLSECEIINSDPLSKPDHRDKSASSTVNNPTLSVHDPVRSKLSTSPKLDQTDENTSEKVMTPPVTSQSNFNLELNESLSASDDEFLASAVVNSEKCNNTGSKSEPVHSDTEISDPDELDFKDNPPCPFVKVRKIKSVCTVEKRMSYNEKQKKKESVTSPKGTEKGLSPDDALKSADNEESVRNKPLKKSKTLSSSRAEDKSHDSQSKSRFHTATDQEIEDLQRDSKSERTQKQTKWGVKLFKEWCDYVGEDSNFETLPADDLSELLKRFYCEMRTREGKKYSRASLLCIRASLQRYLSAPPFNSKINIMSDSAFVKANTVITGTIKNMKKKGEDSSKRHPPISPDDVKKLYSTGTLSNQSPKSLQHKTFFELLLHFGRRGREGLRDLRKQDIIFQTDQDGHEYATLNFHPYEKNHNSVSHHETDHDQKMYSTGGDDCPIESLKFYMSKLNKDCESFFQKPKPKFTPSSPTWYQNSPVGLNTIGQFIATISTLAGLKTRYTNHCIRATTITSLRDDGKQDLEIISVTGHRSLASIDSYSRVKDSKRREMSHTLSKFIGKKTSDDTEKYQSAPSTSTMPIIHEEEENCSPISPQKVLSTKQPSAPTVAVVKPSPRKFKTPTKYSKAEDSPVRRSPRLMNKQRIPPDSAKSCKKLSFLDGKQSEESQEAKEIPSNIKTQPSGQTIIIQSGSNVHIHYH